MLVDALIVIDMQNGVLLDNEQEIYRREQLINLVNQRISLYRSQGRKIIFVQHNDPWLKKDSQDWKLIPELNIEIEKDNFIDKTHANSFYKTNLQELLEEVKVTSLEFCGAQTEFCVNTTVVMAHGLGYKCYMKSGATSTYDNAQMTAKETVEFYEEHLWKGRFIEFY
ncbi:cysteine hydrolase family protein [Lactococcus nasutitermitis]|uniref:Cysteine hydrolase family protein n=1 Tax=Lactococcus nasutitermitis TaxID=1652957 RepID=A0ABV9JCX2_9LACT|nr:cysteine hydrolase family protein [Lactococcus nasutitermitis]